MSQTIYKSLAIISAIGISLSAPALYAQEMQMEHAPGKEKKDLEKMNPESGKKKQDSGTMDNGNMGSMKMESGSMDRSSGDMKMESGSKGAMKMPPMLGGSPPADARDPHAYSDGYEYRGIGGFEETDMMMVNKFIADQFEYRNNNGNDTLTWDMQGWYGGDYNKLWVKFEGEDETSANAGEMELQALYSRTVAAFWDFQAGIRYDTAYGTDSPGDRTFAVLGFQGLAPYWFELEPAIFLSDKGDFSARLVASYDLLFTQRLILQPRGEINISASEVRQYDIGSGLNDIQLDLRLRYEIRRKFAPYVGIAWSRKFGNTARLTRASGGIVDFCPLLQVFVSGSDLELISSAFYLPLISLRIRNLAGCRLS